MISIPWRVLMKQKFFAFLIFIFYRCLQMTWKIQIIESEDFKKDLEEKQPYLISLWHGNELAILHISKRYKLSALVSHSKDGQLMTNVLQMMGVKIARGSSSRGGVGGLKALIRLIKKGFATVYAVDGPKGPYRVIKPGLFEAAKLSRAKIYPSGIAVSNYWMSKRSWNKAILPKPFSKIVMVIGKPMTAEAVKADPRSTDLRLEMTQSMHNAEQDALARLAEM
ncbi:MAG: hypothetical protein CL674_01740 [Bdellovibrionaceae bacterium]|nr:hypothetical protein [Pseudobdellovibrionaceae bacterium]|tara:strand:+ start:13446 stop:14117 length:672 start_codon:yes stop_codon:yes gene_type:complete